MSNITAAGIDPGGTVLAVVVWLAAGGGLWAFGSWRRRHRQHDAG